ncbi:MAG: hypothetical protein QOG53_3577 [Frankiales bacterium]|nr:hypothetical protein [Frankiales bacterium]
MPRPARNIRRFVAMAAVLLVAAALPAHAQVRQPGGGAVPRHAALTLQLPADRCIAGCDATGDYAFFDAAAVGSLAPDGTADLDGDGAQDVVTLEDDGDGFATVAVRRGADGIQLWSATVSSLLAIVPMRVGAPARPGVVLVTGGSDAPAERTSMSAYDGRTGKQIWGHKYTPEFNGVPTRDAASRLEDALPTGVGTATSLLMTYRHNVPVTSTSGDIVVQAVVVSGVTGAATPSGRALTTRYNKLGRPRVAALTDLTGDGAADYGLSAPGRFEARSSASGATLWTSTSNDQIFFAVPDTTGDHVSEIVVAHTLRNGRTGAALFTMPGGTQRVAGDADGDGRSDLFDVTSSDRDKSLRLRVYDGAHGRILWTRWFLAPQLQYSWVSGAPTGDVGGDGVQDVSVVTSGGTRSGNSIRHSYLVNGRDGVVQPWPGDIGTPLYASFDGRGDDFSASVATATADVIRINDGRDGHELLRFEAAPTSGGYASGALVTLGRFAPGASGLLSVATTGEFHEGSVVVRVLDSSGALRWQTVGGYFAI